jgi:regulator of protease activity HflC (stomatin/prohibitin superfamily)
MGGALGLILTVLFGVCSLKCCNRVDPGYVAVVVDMLGDDKGAEGTELHTGLHWVAPWKSLYQFPIFEQNETWTGERDGFSFQTCEGMAVSADIGITYHLRPSSIPTIFSKYRRGMDEISHVFIRNYLRDAIAKAAGKMRIEQLYSDGKEAFFDEVEQHVRADLDPLGIVVSRIYLIGRFHFPQTVITALNAKIEAIQRAQQRENELREAEAEAKKQIAKADGAARCALLKAESEAKANKLLSESVTDRLVLLQAVQAWDGHLPQVMTDGAVPMFNLGAIKQ